MLPMQAVDLGLIQPTERDPFDPTEDDEGPNVYTVNDQFIKPINGLFGDTSFALLWHPCGLKCDLFITHAWMEGIFEFTDKVLASWPAGTRHAYCCMLSNPQTLDISDLISSPADSPFAAALQSAHIMVALPNHSSSIYSRLWCVYEAVLAVEKGIPIETATRSSRSRLWPMLLVVVLLFLGGMALGRLYCYFDIPESKTGDLVIALIGNVPLMLSLAIAGDRASMICNCVGACTSGFFWYCGGVDALSVCFSVVFLAFYLLSEGDRAHRGEVHTAAEQLSSGFSGSIRDAQCSSSADYHSIWSAVGDKVVAVDHSIDVLRCAGMSTPSLRDASIAGVRFENAGLMEFAFLAFKYPCSVYFSFSFVHFGGWLLVCLGVALVLLEVTWTVLLFLFQRDRRALHLKIAYRIFMLGLPCLILVRLIVGSPLVPLRSPSMAVFAGLMLVPTCGLASLLSALGASRLARILGPRFARLLVARGLTLPGSCCCRKASACPSSDGESSSPDEAAGSLDGRSCSDEGSDG